MKQFSSLFTAVVLAFCFALLQPATAQQSSINPHGEIKLGISCNSCHLTEAWTPLKDEISFYHSMQTGFPLTGSHTQTACASCHIGLKFDQPKSATTECASCHIDVHQGSLGENCVDCHNTTLFQDVEGIALHAQTSFPLTGTHAQLNCVSCHTDDVNGAFTPLDTQCITCHQADYDNAQSVDHLTAGFPTECETCHNDLQWQGTLFDHVIASSGFDLIGAHDRLQCASCHRSPDLTPIFTATNDQQCIDCHQEDYDDEHAGSGFPVTCLECHNQETWDDAIFDHIAASEGFGLLGAHEQLQCESCHTLPDLAVTFQPPPSSDQDCYSCHQPDYDDEHAGSGFPTACLDCHNTTTWDDAVFDHIASSNGFALLGAHETASCATCHSIPDMAVLFQPPPTSDQDCLSCHQADYDDEHTGSGFPTTCLECHNTTTWDDADFNHVTASNGFDLLGAHDALQCESCHSMPDLALTFQPPPSSDQDCLTCHQADYDDEHTGSGFPTTCLECHNTTTWDDADFSHATASNGFDLLGAHEQINCASCHNLPDYSLTFQPPPSSDQDCLTCHQADYDDEHAGSGFPTTCLECHNTTTWDDADFNHVTASNGFDLIGAHDMLQCESCHTMPDLGILFQPPPSSDQDCLTCHQADYDDEHAGSGFPTTCLDCHNATTWDEVNFDHVASSGGFELLGAHETANCSTCHNLPDYSLIFQPPPANDQECIACHQSDYDDEHAGSNFPTTCLECHNTNTWDEVNFDHVTSSDGFELLGAHDQIACTSCHNLPDYSLTFQPPPSSDQECITCHQADYDDEHAGTGFSTACLDCHTTETWDGAEFDHDALYFPIYSGNHRGEWNNDCASCHTQPNNFAFFSCDGACHEHTQAEMNNEHDDVNGYAYDFPLCLSCHPDGDE